MQTINNKEGKDVILLIGRVGWGWVVGGRKPTR